jgi:hypothetical protein
MPITFENDNNVIVYALEKVIAYARRSQQIFVAQCVWWLASVIGLEQGLINHVDNIQSREGNTASRAKADHHIEVVRDLRGVSTTPRDIQEERRQVHPDRVLQISKGKSVSPVPRDLTEDQRLDLILESAERVIQESFRDRTIAQQGRVNPLPMTKAQLKKARKAKNLQDARNKLETDRQERLRQIRIQVIKRLAKDD